MDDEELLLNGWDRPCSLRGCCPQQELAWVEFGFGGVFSDVEMDALEVVFVADEAVEVFGLPEGAGGACCFVDLSGGEAFPGEHDLLQFVAFKEGEKDMHVIGHDDEGPELSALAFEEEQGVGYDLGVSGVTQDAGAVAGVEVVIHGLAEAVVVFGFVFF